MRNKQSNYDTIALPFHGNKNNSQRKIRRLKIPAKTKIKVTNGNGGNDTFEFDISSDVIDYRQTSCKTLEKPV